MGLKIEGAEFVQRRGKLIVPLTVSILIFALGVIGAAALLVDTGTGIDWPLVALPGFVLISGCYFLSYWGGQYLSPSRLQLLKSGLVLKTFAKESVWNWTQVSNFRVRRWGIRFDVADPTSGAIKAGFLPGNWSAELDDVIKSLNTSQAQYSPDGANRTPAGAGAALSMSDVGQLGVGLVIVALIFLRAITMAIENDHQDKLSTPFIKQKAFLALPNCPTSIAVHDLIPVACDDARYQIREGYSRYDLPHIKGHWLRVGSDAIGIGFCGPKACWVDTVLRNHFPTN